MPIRKDNARQGPTSQWLLGLIEEFLTINNMDNDGNYFGWLVNKDRTLVQRLRDGGDVSITRMDDILAFMQYPATFRRTSAGLGPVNFRILKPLIIKPKEIP